MNKLLFQYCPKLAILNADNTSLLLCKRKGEVEYNEVFSLIGGEMEHEDQNIVEALRREKNEEVSEEFRLRLSATRSKGWVKIHMKPCAK